MNTNSFFNAIREGDITSIANLLDSHIEFLEIIDERGSTPLILAAYYNQKELVDFLLEKGAQVDRQDGSGNTALMGVCFKGYIEIVNSLIKAGANVNLKNTMGGTCLIYAATFGHVEIAKVLLDSGADVSIKDARGNTALDHATMKEAGELIALLTNKS